MIMAYTRRDFLQTTLATSAVLAAPRLLRAGEAETVYADGIVIDGLGFPGGEGGDEYTALTQQEVADVAASGLTATHLTVGDVGTMAPLAAYEKIVRSVAKWEHDIAAYADVLASVRSVGDILAAKASGRTGLIYGLQDGVAFEDDTERLDSLAWLGIRVIQPTYNRRNLLGDGCMEPSDAGLSRTGREAVERMQALGILLDLSHCGRRTAADAIAMATRPVAFTHTGCYALAEHPRHRTDEELKAVATTGGVIGIFIMPYLARGAQPTADDVIAHLEHALDVAGEDHVSLGTDGTVSPTEITEEYKENFRAITRRRQELGIAAPYETEEGYLFASDLNTPRRFETLTERLLARGHSPERIEKILGGNLLRVFGEAWGASAAA